MQLVSKDGISGTTQRHFRHFDHSFSLRSPWKKNKTTAFHLQKFKLGKRAEWPAGWLCLPNPSEDYGICETSAVIAFLHPPSADKKCVFTGCFRSRRMWRLMKVVKGMMEHCSSVVIFFRESPWKHSFNGRLTVTMSHIFIINETTPTSPA